MAGIAQNGQKCLIFIVVALLRLGNIKERWKKTERYIQSIKNIYKLKWLSHSISLIHCLFNSGNSF